MKQALETGREQGATLEHALAVFLLSYWSTPQTTTGVLPRTLLMGHNLSTRLDLIEPDIGKQVREQQYHQKVQHDPHSHERHFPLVNV